MVCVELAEELGLMRRPRQCLQMADARGNEYMSEGRRRKIALSISSLSGREEGASDEVP